MLKYLILSMMLLCCGDCKGDAHYSLVVTLDPGESVMIKSADGKHQAFVDFGFNGKGVINKSVSADESYHLEYHLIIWIQCDGCGGFYDAMEGGCRNPYCPSKYS